LSKGFRHLLHPYASARERRGGFWSKFGLFAANWTVLGYGHTGQGSNDHVPLPDGLVYYTFPHLWCSCNRSTSCAFACFPLVNRHLS
jgi:hypothetical protein